MEVTAYNPVKGRLETMDIELTDENATWFNDCLNNHDIHKITDTKNGLLISEFGYSYPFWIEGKSRGDIDFSKEEARALIQIYE
jgi:hypothetical protein